MKKKISTRDPDITGSYPAMRRAARRAKKRAVEAGTPLVVMRDGKVVDDNASRSVSPRNGREKKSA
ncbi:MAG: hypothetical protein ABSB74_04015 [Tepidisphaeraceae bacterium]